MNDLKPEFIKTLNSIARKTTSKYLKLTQAEQRQGLDRIANWF